MLLRPFHIVVWSYGEAEEVIELKNFPTFALRGSDSELSQMMIGMPIP